MSKDFGIGYKYTYCPAAGQWRRWAACPGKAGAKRLTAFFQFKVQGAKFKVETSRKVASKGGKCRMDIAHQKWLFWKWQVLVAQASRLYHGGNLKSASTRAFSRFRPGKKLLL
jgi:hypothetical protein